MEGIDVSYTDEHVRELGRQWVEAELRGDFEALDALSMPDFTLVGPLGFVVDKNQWLDRHRIGIFKIAVLNWTDVTVRTYADAAVAVGVQAQEAAYQGRPSSGRFRTTQFFVTSGDSFLLAGMHVSPIAPPPDISTPR